jgi:hypothetical protein
MDTMAWSIIRDWKSTKNEQARYEDAERIASDMDAGGCLAKFKTAIKSIDHDWYTRSGIGVDQKPAEVVPVSVDKCVKATVSLRCCMECNHPSVFREHVDEGIMEGGERRRGGETDVEAEDGTRFRWWTGMRKSSNSHL